MSTMTKVVALVAVMFSVAHAMDSADVLPVGINSPALRAGVITGIDQRYADDGRLLSLDDYHSIEFDAPTLMRIEPEAGRLVSVLNQFGRQSLGDELNLGTLKVRTRPEVSYFAPVHAYGVTSKWTLAVGVPIVSYKNEISLIQEGSNVAAIESQVRGVSPELDQAFDRLNGSLVTSVNNELEAKGYKPLADRDETIIGDVQLASIYQFTNERRVKSAVKTILSLPTGPGNDPDDIADLGAFGQTALENIGLLTVTPLSRLTFAGKAAYRWNVPDRIEKRVPVSEHDTLPGPERKERLSRDPGDQITLGASTTHEFIPRWSAAVGFERIWTGATKFSGSRGYDYSLLERDTSSQSDRLRVAVDYSSVQAYVSKQAKIPTMVSYEYSDTIAGRNIERQTVHELWLTLFF